MIEENRDSQESSEQEDEPPSCSLDSLESSIRHLFSPYWQFNVRSNDYDQSVSISLRLPKIKSHSYEMFRIYTDNEVADNTKFISSPRVCHPECAGFVKKVLEQQGYSSFHNPYLSYIDKRFKQELEKTRESYEE